MPAITGSDSGPAGGRGAGGFAGGGSGFAAAGGAAGAGAAGAGCDRWGAPPPPPRLITTGGGFATWPVGAPKGVARADELGGGTFDDAAFVAPPVPPLPPAPLVSMISCPAVEAMLSGVIAGPMVAPMSTPDARTITPTTPNDFRAAGVSSGSLRSGTWKGSSPRRAPHARQ